jgi:glycine/D-amino acid oxidase-like deaminating enzyme/nitrite reductase/ring-hydroxylating ferredoxin subunit
MKPESERTVSSWMATAPTPALSPLDHADQADVCIVGAGIAGLSTAYLLASAGKSVLVLDDGPVGGGQTQRTTAHLSNAIDDRYVEIERLHGQDGAHRAAESHSAAIEKIAWIVSTEGIACDFERVDGYLFVPPGESTDILDAELEAAQRAGLKDVEKLPHLPASFDGGPCLRFPRQAQFHPLKYLSGLASALRKKGGRIFTGTHAQRISGGFVPVVDTAKGPKVTCSAVVVATNTPVNDRVAIHTKQAPYLTYVIAAPVPRGSVTKALYWDTADPYHYVRLQTLDGLPRDAAYLATEPSDLLIVGGEDHKTGQADDHDERSRRLEAWARLRFPRMGQVAYRWSGQVMEPVDGLAFIGPNPGDEPHVYIATGDSGMGMTHGTIAGILLTDLILGRTNPWATLYDPARKTLRSAGEFTRQNLNVAMQYGAWLKPGDVASVTEILPDQGAVISRGLHKVAVYRDTANALHQMSATCPHLGCVVAWNDMEKTWDCPCHGSRFNACGKVINGPANKGLAPAEP